MWIMTPFGIIMPAQAEDNAPISGDPADWFQVRARDRAALVHLRKRYMNDRLRRIIHTPQRDYEYRAYCLKTDFAEAMRRMLLEVDYEKFKPEARTKSLHDLYLRIWAVVFTHYESKWTAPTGPVRRRWYEDK